MRESQSSPHLELETLLAEWTSTSVGRRTFLLSLPALLAACATGEKTRYREGDNEGQQVALTISDERRMTQEVMPKMRQEYPVLRDPALQSYVSGLGRKLVSRNELEGNPYNYSFTVVDVPYVNAFALPAGTVFVTAPLIAMAETEAELVGVIGHEVGHIKARHTAERMAKAEQTGKRSWLYALGGAIVGAGVGYGVGKALCRKDDSTCLSQATQMGGSLGAGGGLLIQKFAFMANSREDEMEADRIGFRTALNAGYDKDQIGSFYAKLLRMEQSARRSGSPIMTAVADAMSTHPPSRERVDQMRDLANEVQNPRGVIVSSTQFDKMRKVAAAHARDSASRAKSQSG